MTIRRACNLIARAAAFLLLLTACASASTGASEQAAQPDAPASDTAQSDDASDTATESRDEAQVETVNESQVSPVFEALGFDPADRQTARTEFTTEAEELVRQCMTNAGFDYVPNLPSAPPSVSRLWELQDSLSAEQFVEQYGFGISTVLELDFQEEGVLAFVEIMIGPPPTEARSPGEQAAYELALNGETIQGLSAEEAQSQAFERGNFFGAEGSCRQAGYSAADNTLGDKFNNLFELLGDEYDALNEQVDNDPRIRDMNSRWQTCMAEAGYSYENVREAVDEITTESTALRNGFQTSPEALAIFAAAGQANLSTMNADDRFNFLETQGAFQGFSMVPSLQSELDALIDRELAIAARNETCSDGELVSQVVLEYEQAFVEQHADQLRLIASGET